MFCGKAGSLLNIFLEQAEIDRRECIVTNALLCPIQDKDELGKAAIYEAIRCCNKRRQEEGDLKNAGFIVGLGAYAGYALTGHDGIGNVRGCVQHTAWGPSIITYHPAFVLRGNDAYAQLIVADFENALRYHKGEKDRNLRISIGPSPAELRVAISYILGSKKRYALDVEADSLDMLSANLNVLGIAYTTEQFIHSLVIPWWEGNYTEDEWKDILRYLKRLFRSTHVTMVAHNAQYDTTLVERNVCEIEHPIRDTLIAHKAVWPEIRHDLQNVVSQFLLVEPWKFRFWQKERERQRLLRRYESAKGALSRATTEKTKAKCRSRVRGAGADWQAAWAREPRELCIYNGHDVGYTAAVDECLEDEVKRAKVSRVVMVDSKLSEVTRRMTIDGIPLRVDTRDSLSRTLKKRVDKARTKLKALVRNPPKSKEAEIKKARRELLKISPEDWNPNSQFHKIALLDAYDVPVLATTPTGLRSTARKHLVDFNDDPSVEALLEYQDANKVLTTFVEGKGLIIDKKGYLHPSWNAHAAEKKDPEKYGTVSGRWASSPNMQNWPKEVRKLIGFKEKDPRVIISADYAQLELRILALLSGEERLIKAFMDPKRDPHADNAKALFGDKFTSLEPHGKKWDELRKMTKTSTYAWMYGAGSQTMYMTIKQDFPDMTMRQVEFIRERFNEMCPAIMDYREDLLEQVYDTGEIRTLLLNRRRVYPLAGIAEPSASEIWNFPIQGTAADIIGIRVLKLYPHLPRDVILISQIHDAILLTAMADKADWVASLAKKYLEMTVRYNGNVMHFPVDVKIGKTWGDT